VSVTTGPVVPGVPSGPAVPPPPPPGPGVRPPFIAPPTDGLRTRRRLGILSLVVSVVLLCGGIVAGINVLIAYSKTTYLDQAEQVVSQYAGDLNLKHYDEAYGLLCSVDQDAVPLPVFEAQFTRRPVVEWRVFPANLVNGTAVVRADLMLSDGSIDTHDYPVIVTDDGLRVCP